MTLTKLNTLANAINEQHDLAEQHARTALEHVYQAGQLLLEAKSLCEHGSWGAWLKDNFRGSDRTARSYMQVAANWEALEPKRQHVADLSLRGALEVLAEPKEDVMHVYNDETAANVQRVAHSEPEDRTHVSEAEHAEAPQVDTEIIRTMLENCPLLPGEAETVDARLATPGTTEQALVDALVRLAQELDEQLWALKIRADEGKLLCPPDMTEAQQARAVSEIVSFNYRCQREIKRWVYGIASTTGASPELRLQRATREADEVFWELGEQGARYKFRGENDKLKQFYTSMPSKTKKEIDSYIRVFEVFYLQGSLEKAAEDYKQFRRYTLVKGAVASGLLKNHPERLGEFAEKTGQSPELVRELARVYDEAAAA